MATAKLRRRVLLNVVVFLAVYALLLSAFWDHRDTFAVGAARGTAIGIPLVMLLLIVGTVYFTLKSGGGWRGVKKNLRRNLFGLFALDWSKREKR